MPSERTKNALLTLAITGALLLLVVGGVPFAHGLHSYGGSMMHGHQWIFWAIALAGIGTAVVLYFRRR